MQAFPGEGEAVHRAQHDPVRLAEAPQENVSPSSKTLEIGWRTTSTEAGLTACSPEADVEID
jgi:hypothetical protein